MKKLLITLVLLAVIISGFIYIKSDRVAAPTPKPATVVRKSKLQAFNKSAQSISDPTSNWVVVNKQHPLTPKTYAPSDLVFPNVPLRVQGNESMQLRKEAALALEQMTTNAKVEGINLMLSSGYRSYDYQVNLYNGYVQSQGQDVADTQSARPGYSEHQTGFAADLEPTTKVCEVEDCFADTPEGTWLAANSYKYGYILRYTRTDQALTGYKNEAWHFRYVGVKLASQLKTSGITTLEAFFSISGGSKY